MKMYNDCFKENTIFFEYNDVCYSSADIFIANQNNLDMIVNLMKRIEKLENYLVVPQTCVEYIYVKYDDRYSKPSTKKICKVKDFEKVEKAASDGWIYQFDGWFKTTRNYGRTYWSKLNISPFTKRIEMFREDEWLKRFFGTTRTTPRNFINISIKEYYERLKKINRI